jgi:hypothetical protein
MLLLQPIQSSVLPLDNCLDLIGDDDQLDIFLYSICISPASHSMPTLSKAHPIAQSRATRKYLSSGRNFRFSVSRVEVG